jgi:hypothetical protein
MRAFLNQMFRLCRGLCIFGMVLCVQQKILLAQAPADTLSRIEVTAHAEALAVPQNQAFDVYLTIRWSGKQSRIVVAPVETPIFTNLSIVETGSANQVDQINGRTISTRTYIYRVMPIERGMAYIDGAIIEYQDMAGADSTDISTIRLATDRLEVKILPPDEPTNYTYIAIIVALHIAALAGIRYWRKCRKQKREAVSETVLTSTPVSTQLLDELRSVKPETASDYSAAFDTITKLLRRLCKSEFACDISGKSMTLVRSELEQAGVADELITHAESILKAEEVYKFSGKDMDAGEYQLLYTALEAVLLRAAAGGPAGTAD